MAPPPDSGVTAWHPPLSPPPDSGVAVWHPPPHPGVAVWHHLAGRLPPPSPLDKSLLVTQARRSGGTPSITGAHEDPPVHDPSRAPAHESRKPPLAISKRPANNSHRDASHTIKSRARRNPEATGFRGPAAPDHLTAIKRPERKLLVASIAPQRLQRSVASPKQGPHTLRDLGRCIKKYF